MDIWIYMAEYGDQSPSRVDPDSGAEIPTDSDERRRAWKNSLTKLSSMINYCLSSAQLVKYF